MDNKAKANVVAHEIIVSLVGCTLHGHLLGRATYQCACLQLSGIRVVVRRQQWWRPANSVFGQCVEVHHQEAYRNNAGYPGGTSINHLEFDSLRIDGQYGRHGYIWTCSETWTTKCLWVYLYLSIQFVCQISYLAQSCSVWLECVAIACNVSGYVIDIHNCKEYKSNSIQSQPRTKNHAMWLSIARKYHSIMSYFAIHVTKNMTTWHHICMSSQPKMRLTPTKTWL